MNGMAAGDDESSAGNQAIARLSNPELARKGSKPAKLGIIGTGNVGCAIARAVD
jgi:lactate dehydrogenase-like 2-hydroxyacid dehydrogenase